ncbi:MAG: tryptophan--tRNA ligase [Patescibacteria group bacterium]
MNQEQKILLSGIQPTGAPHLGNYFGAMRQFVELQNEYQAHIMIADLHALTTVKEASKLRENILNLAIDYLAIGLDPEKVVLFRQSQVPAHTELAWIFNCLVTMPYLERAHAYKDAEQKAKEVNVGLFDYPILMAADILLYGSDVVPVGQDQKQHVEIARDVAEKFNRVYSEAFKLPEALILPNVGVVPGLDGRKMSKSYGNTIPLFAEPEEMKKLVMSIKTDSKGVEEAKDPETCNVFALHKLFSENDLPELTKRYKEGGIGYAEAKEILFNNMNNYLAPLREKRAEIAKNPEHVQEILKAGAEKARAVASEKMQKVRELVGLN